MQLAQALENADFNLFQAIVEQAPDAIIFADREGAIRVWNRGAETVFGYAAAEVLGGSLDVIIPERLRRAGSRRRARRSMPAASPAMRLPTTAPAPGTAACSVVAQAA